MSGSMYMENPYCRGAGGVWLKGCLHLHTTRSDGRAAPEDMLKAYAAQGYDFLAISDHDVASDYTGLDPLGMTLLHGCEVSAGGPHILQVGGMPGPGARWGFHACRNRKPVIETLVWAWVGESNHLVEHYGIIEF